MKPSRPTLRSSRRLDRSVAWWSVLLLVALAGVLAALFLSARLLLSLATEQGPEPSDSPAVAYHSGATGVLLLRDDAPNRSEAAPRQW